MLGKTDALGGEFVEHWCLGGLLAVTTEITISKIVGNDEDDVRLGSGEGGGEEEYQKNTHGLTQAVGVLLSNTNSAVDGLENGRRSDKLGILLRVI